MLRRHLCDPVSAGYAAFPAHATHQSAFTRAGRRERFTESASDTDSAPLVPSRQAILGHPQRGRHWRRGRACCHRACCHRAAGAADALPPRQWGQFFDGRAGVSFTKCAAASPEAAPRAACVKAYRRAGPSLARPVLGGRAPGGDPAHFHGTRTQRPCQPVKAVTIRRRAVRGCTRARPSHPSWVRAGSELGHHRVTDGDWASLSRNCAVAGPIVTAAVVARALKAVPFTDEVAGPALLRSSLVRIQTAAAVASVDGRPNRRETKKAPPGWLSGPPAGQHKRSRGPTVGMSANQPNGIPSAP